MVEILPRPEEKVAYVEQMFTRIAPSYDRVNRIMTFGLDQFWRQYVVEAVAPPAYGRALDVGTGTGDFLPLVASWMIGGVVVGLDSCLPMMHEGHAKIKRLCSEAAAASPAPQCVAAFAGGDALCLPFPDNTFDAITTGFTLRNVTDMNAAFREMWRVTRPGGVVACLEVARPRHSLPRLVHRLYFKHVVPWIGALFSGNRNAYVYLHQSARVFPPPDVLAHIMRNAGWHDVQYRLLSLGAVAVHVGTKL